MIIREESMTSYYNKKKQEEPSIGNIITAIGLVKMAIDEEIKQHGQLSKYSQIGKRMKIKDNSYNTCLETNRWADIYGCEVVIISEIYEKKMSTEKWCSMVKAYNPSNGLTYEVNFQEGWLMD